MAGRPGSVMLVWAMVALDWALSLAVVLTLASSRLPLISGELADPALSEVFDELGVEIRPVSGPTVKCTPNTDVVMSNARPVSMLVGFADATAGSANAPSVAPSTASRRTRTAPRPRECVLVRDI